MAVDKLRTELHVPPKAFKEIMLCIILYNEEINIENISIGLQSHS